MASKKFNYFYKITCGCRIQQSKFSMSGIITLTQPVSEDTDLLQMFEKFNSDEYIEYYVRLENFVFLHN